MEADEAKGLSWMLDKGLGHCVLWGSDYPHFDSTYPGAFKEARETFDAVGGNVAKKVVWENPRRYLGSA
jgi:predicted TIM-barrel fold metal-dependent hydrolase